MVTLVRQLEFRSARVYPLRCRCNCFVVYPRVGSTKAWRVAALGSGCAFRRVLVPTWSILPCCPVQFALSLRCKWRMLTRSGVLCGLAYRSCGKHKVAVTLHPESVNSCVVFSHSSVRCVGNWSTLYVEITINQYNFPRRWPLAGSIHKSLKFYCSDKCLRACLCVCIKPPETVVVER